MAITRPHNLHEFSGCGGVPCNDTPAPGIARKSNAYRLHDLRAAALAHKKRRRAVEALLGEDTEPGSEGDPAPAPFIKTPPPVPLPKVEPRAGAAAGNPDIANAPAWAAELLQRVADLQREVATLKANPGHATMPLQPPVVPTSVEGENRPPRSATAAAAQVEDQHKIMEAEILRQMNLETPTVAATAPATPSPAANLTETINTGGAAIGESLMGAGLPPPVAPSRKFIRPQL